MKINNKSAYVLSVCLFCLIGVSSVFGAWENIGGPSGSTGTGVAVIGNTVFMGTEKNLYSTTLETPLNRQRRSP
jgi:hypothetical protein